MGLSDAGMYECVNGHTLDEDYVKGGIKDLAAGGIEACIRVLPDEWETPLQEAYDQYCEDNGPPGADDMHDLLCEVFDEHDGRYGLPATLCPLCQLKYVNQHDVLRYLLQRMGRTYKEMCAEIRETYGGSPDDFYAAIKDTLLGV